MLARFYAEPHKPRCKMSILVRKRFFGGPFHAVDLACFAPRSAAGRLRRARRAERRVARPGIAAPYRRGPRRHWTEHLRGPGRFFYHSRRDSEVSAGCVG